MDRLKKGAFAGVAAIRTGTEQVGARVKEAKDKLSTHPTAGQVGTNFMERIHTTGGRHYEIGGRTVVQEKQLSEGGFAFVWLARDIHTDEELVLKKIPCQDKASILMAKREVEILERLPPHPNLVRYFGHVLDKIDNGHTREVVLLFELCPGGHLLDLLEMHQCRLSEAKILSAFKDICTGVCILHARSPPVQHRDLKVENILLGANGSFKLCDFGSWSDESFSLGTMDRQESSHLVENIERYTTMMYRPPEMVDFYQQYVVSEKVDIWMLGCILFTLMFARHPFQDESTLAISNARYDLPSEPAYSAKLLDLTHWCLARDPADRPSCREVLEILCSFQDGKSLDLPPSVVAQKERHRRLYECRGADMDAPVKQRSKKDRSDRERKHKDGSSKHRTKSEKSRSKESTRENLATWGDTPNGFGVDAWPVATAPPPACHWAAFGSGERQNADSNVWGAWEQPLGAQPSAGSTAPSPSVQSVGSERTGGYRRASEGDANIFASWGGGPSQQAWPQHSPQTSPSGSAGRSWDPFGNPTAQPQGASTTNVQSWPEAGWPPQVQAPVITPRSHDSDAIRRARTAPELTCEAPDRQALQGREGDAPSPAPSPQPVSNGSPWPLDVSPAVARSPWDPPSGPLTVPATNGPSGVASQGPWAQSDDPFDWLRKSSPLPGSKAP